MVRSDDGVRRNGGGNEKTPFLSHRRRALSDVAIPIAERENQAVFQPGQSVHVNLSGMQVGTVTFQAAVTAAVGTIVRQTSEVPSKYLVKLLFSFRGVSEVEVPEERILAA